MKPNNYNPKAKEAFGRSLIDIGVAIFKGLMLLFTVAPASIIVKDVFEDGTSKISLYEALANMSTPTYYMFLGIILIGFLIGHVFRKEGLRYLHEAEEYEKKSAKVSQKYGGTITRCGCNMPCSPYRRR
ncbi:hypothetical protein LZP73_10630 [Shewanella sp. AS16]|uniref:hypothetical protein n=1 Tax=Shewanella sp. AS16 TaxID=2907625 RepID=UPI001F1B2340|nr:hypothetical protein [Shewanella sp. AS16]MCE9686661.1 hypothetical protein [Shewanella sp. AS16]